MQRQPFNFTTFYAILRSDFNFQVSTSLWQRVRACSPLTP